MSCIVQPSGEEKPRAMVMRATGYSYSGAETSNSNIQAHMGNLFSSFEQNAEIYNLSNGMEVIGFASPKNLHQQQSFFNKPPEYDHGAGPSSSSSKAINEPSSTSDQFYHHQHEPSSTSDQFLLVDDSSLRCVFPFEGNEKPSQGLSLSLSSSNNPSSIGFHDHDMRSFVASSSRDWGFNKYYSMNVQSLKQVMQDGFLLGKAANVQFQMGSSKYLVPAQELLSEFCNLGTYKQKNHSSEKKLQKTNQWQDHESASSSSLNSLDLLELQKRKTKLLQMLQEVDRRYKHYCNQMKAVVSSFDAVAGDGAATVYSALASKAMSRHFKCLRDGIVGQIKATKKAMVEKETSVVPGRKRGETPRLRILDQTLRQQKALQQMSMMESHPWRPVRGLPERSVSLLRAWLFEHFLHPYPSDMDKHILARQTGLSRSQVSNWFINARVRLWKPMVEEMYLEEMKEQQNADSIDRNAELAQLGDENGGTQNNNQNNNPQKHLGEDQKPTLDQLGRIDSECLSSIISNNQEKSVGKSSKIRSIRDHQLQHHDFGSFGAMELDFSSYNHNNYGGGVSLTLGLHQHARGSSGVSLAFPPAAPPQNSLLYPRDHIEDCQTVQYSLLDNEGQNLQYKNLMDAQLLHDLAG